MRIKLMRQSLVFGIIIIFITIAFTPALSCNQINNVNVCKNLWLNKSTIDYDYKNQETPPIDSPWKQIVGDFPQGGIENGFGNVYNGNIRGKTTFTIEDKEYLIFGTGNVVVSYSKSDSSLQSMEAGIVAAGLTRLQITLDLVVSIIDKQFKQLISQGCEIWCFNYTLGWQQSVGNKSSALIGGGFGNANNTELTILIPYCPTDSDITYLYAGTWNQREGLELWRTTDPINGVWEPIIHNMGTGIFSSGFGNPKNAAAYSAAIFNGWLYIGTMNWFDGCEIWRTNGTVWQRVIGSEPRLSSYSNGFGDDDRGFERDIYAWEMLVYNDSHGEQLYVGTFNIAGCELWRTSNGLNWECLVGENGILQRGFNERASKLSTHNYGIRRMRVFNNSLYMGSASTPAFTFQYNKKYPFNPFLDRTRTFEFNLGQGCSIWRYNGSTLSRIIGGYGTKNCCNGLGDQTNAYIWSLIEYDGRLFAGTMNPGTYCVNITSVKKPLRRPVITFELINKKSKTTGFGGCEIWYTNDGEGWYQIVGNEAHRGSEIWPQNGFGDKNNVGARAFVMYQNSLYVGIMNGLDGCEVWRFNGSSYPDEPLTCIRQKRITFESGRNKLYGEIYYPADEKQKYPGIIFCEGYASYTDAYSWIPQALAEQGYVVLIFDPPGLGQSEGIFRKRGIKIPLLNLFIRSSAFIETPIQYFLRNWVQATSDALTYLLEESPVTQLVNNTHIGLIGHSLGGITVTETAAKDNRINAVVALSHGNSFSIKNIDVPIQFQCGGSDLLSLSFLVLRSCYRKASTPKELIVIKRGSHWGFTTAFDSHCPCPEWQKDVCLRYAIGWFDYFLKNKPDAYNTITTGSQHLSKLLKSRYNFGEGEQILK